MRDWTPLVGYGSVVDLAVSATAYLILYPLPAFSTTNEEFLVSDEEESGLFLERIVGDILVVAAEEQAVTVAWCLMPMGADYEAVTVNEPYTSDWDANSSEWANEKFWDKRLYTATDGLNTPSLVDHPYWTQVDCHPRMLLGVKRNLWPVLVMQNYSTTDRALFQHHLRAFWK